jgi:N-acetylglucosaminyldiphosphoundecaprenol N-acetyl-beta-D-mannosaminyltransferase
MIAVVLLLAAAAMVWWAVLAQRWPLWLGGAAFIALGYVLGPPLWTAHLGPLALTVDRLLLAGLGAAFLWQWRTGRTQWATLTGFDWLLVAALSYFTIRCAMTPPPDIDGSAAGRWWRLVAAFWIPAALYLGARCAPPAERPWRLMLWTLAGLGAFLTVTAFAEITHQWWAVFPRYIADPNLGTHFGRARGPALNSASLGIYLTLCFWAAWFLWPRVTRPQQLALVGLLTAIAGGIFVTYTRSTWIGLAAGLAVVPLLQMPRKFRVPATLGVVFAGIVAAAALGTWVTDLKRKDADESAEHSVYQRASFAYVSMQMFRDAPLFGCGFGRFYDKKIPYLADRSQEFELESLRTLDHHNTFLSVLTETGLIGFALFVGLLAAWFRAAWQLYCRGAEPWQRAQGLFAIAGLLNYIASALFHDLTLLPTEHWPLFFTAGISVGLVAHSRVRREVAVRLPDPSSAPAPRQLPLRPTPRTEPHMTSPPASIRLFGMTVNRLTMTETLDTVVHWLDEPRGAACRFVVTPNVDHAVLFQSDERLRSAYAAAALVLADGAPVVLASRLLGRGLPERVAGSDLAPALFNRTAGARPITVFLLGAAPGVADRAAHVIEQRWPGVKVVGTLSPPLGFEKNAAENERILSAIAAASPDVLLVGLGAPKQELWTHAHADRLQAKVALCIGATIDFLAGEKRRAPHWMRRTGLEWLHRLASEPRRLAMRYLRDAWVFPQLVWRDWRGC